MMAIHHEHEGHWPAEWETMFTPPKILLEDFEGGSEDEVTDSPHSGDKLSPLKDLTPRQSEIDIDMLFSPNESESSRGADEEQGSENSNSAQSFEAKESDADSSLPDSHTSFEFAHSDQFAHSSFSLGSPFHRVNFAFDPELAHGHGLETPIKTEPIREEDLPVAPVFDPSQYEGGDAEIPSSQIEDSESEKKEGGETTKNDEKDAAPAPDPDPVPIAAAIPAPVSAPASVSSSSASSRKRSRRVPRPSSKSSRKSQVKVKSETKVFSSAREENSYGFLSEILPRAVPKPREQRTFNCATCKATFNRQSHLERHNLSHTGERPFPCSMEGCGKAFTRKEHLKRHIDNTHASSSPCICQKCDKALKDPWSLRKHLKTKHSDD